jgi:hypothetical protein
LKPGRRKPTLRAPAWRKAGTLDALLEYLAALEAELEELAAELAAYQLNDDDPLK